MDKLKQWLGQIDLLNGNSHWIAEVVAVVIAALMIDILQRFILKNLEHRAGGTGNPWDDALVFALKKPLSFFIWVLAISFSMEIGGKHFDSTMMSYVAPGRTVGVIVSIGAFLLRWIKEMEAIILRRDGAFGNSSFDITTVNALRKIGSLAVWVVMIIVALQSLGFNLSAVLTVGGIGGVAVGFASRDVVANYFGGLMVYITQPFKVGDWIRSPDRQLEGTIEEIGWYMTRIRTFDKRPLYVPNAIFTSIMVENPSRMSNRRIKETIGIRYDDIAQMNAITKAVKEMLKNHEEIDSSQTLIVNFDVFGPSSCDFLVYTFTKTTEWIRYHEIKQDVLLKIAKIIEEHGAEIAFPTRTLHMVSGDKKS